MDFEFTQEDGQKLLEYSGALSTQTGGATGTGLGGFGGANIGGFAPEQPQAAADIVSIPEPNFMGNGTVEDYTETMSRLVLSEGPDAFAAFVNEHRTALAQGAPFDERIADTMLLCFKMGISAQNGACANMLGALYYTGQVFDQDYEKALELYTMAMDWGCTQAIVNLGYIYEYGRTGAPNPTKAFEMYALACALEPNSEALYKLGDAYANGTGVNENMKLALQLWERSLDIAESSEEAAQPAMRIAPLLIKQEDNGGAEFNPMRALALYQAAEIGLRIDIASGLDYYAPRLEEAIEGQNTARALVDALKYV